MSRRDILCTISQCHERGIAHLDIKPGNFLFLKANQLKSPLKAIDFGLAVYCKPKEVLNDVGWANCGHPILWKICVCASLSLITIKETQHKNAQIKTIKVLAQAHITSTILSCFGLIRHLYMACVQEFCSCLISVWLMQDRFNPMVCCSRSAQESSDSSSRCLERRHHSIPNAYRPSSFRRPQGQVQELLFTPNGKTVECKFIQQDQKSCTITIPRHSFVMEHVLWMGISLLLGRWATHPVNQHHHMIFKTIATIVCLQTHTDILDMQNAISACLSRH